MKPLLGCIADDFTGATDLANELTRAGMRVVQLIGIPKSAIIPRDVDAIIIALKSRTNPVEDAISMSLKALEWLKGKGCRQYLFKYCSTFDSTDKGNIGPVTEALMSQLKVGFTIACPAFPRNKRVVFKGHLFVQDSLLNESGMQDHPLTPMTDSNLVSVLNKQTECDIGLVDYQVLHEGVEAIGEEFSKLQKNKQKIAIIDTLFDEDLLNIAHAAKDMVLITGGSAIAAGLVENFKRSKLLSKQSVKADYRPDKTLPSVILSGSCSRATQAQIKYAANHYQTFKINPLLLADGKQSVSGIMEWAKTHVGNTPILIYSTNDHEVLKEVQEILGTKYAGELIEQCLADVAVNLAKLNVRQFVVAGGETSGAVVKALNVSGLYIGSEIDPGVPWTQSIEQIGIKLALKSGNFGGEDFFLKAFNV